MNRMDDGEYFECQDCAHIWKIARLPVKKDAGAERRKGAARHNGKKQP